MQLSNMPDYRAHLSRHGHNLSHDFSFTSATGHLLTVFAQTLNPKEHIKGHIDLFTRTQPLVGCPNADIEEFIDYFFVPYDMLWSGFGDSFFQTNEPFSTAIKPTVNGDLPVVSFGDFSEEICTLYNDNQLILNKDYYGLDLRFLSVYRNLFHNFINPNCVFSSLAVDMAPDDSGMPNLAIPLDFYQPSIFPDVLLAYNCIYQNFYRLDDRELFDASMYNIDAFVYDNGFNLELNERQVSLRYRARDFDYFTAGTVAPLINPLNLQAGSANNSLLKINNYLATNFNSSINAVRADGVQYHHDLTDQPIGSIGFANGTDVPNTQSLRTMFAVEKLLSVTNRAKKTYDAQVMAHLGVPVPIDYKHQIQFIGQQKGMIHIGEVISTAGTEDNSLGDIAGKGYGGVNNKDIDFTAPCHGIVLGIFSCVPKVRYYVGNVKQFCKTDRLSFYWPEYEHLGMQPIFQWEAMSCPNSYVYKGGLDWSARTAVINWQMRYDEYKHQISRVSPAFAKTQISTNLNGQRGQFLGFNNWASWVISTRPYEVDFAGDNTLVPPLRSYLASPCMLNDIMAIQYPDVRLQYTEGGVNHGGYWDAYDSSFWTWQTVDTTEANKKCFVWNIASLFYRDPLLHFANCKFKLVSTMSDNTLPELAAV